MEELGAVEAIFLVGWFIMGIIYSVIIFKILHSVFNYVFWGDGFSKHLMGIFFGGMMLSGLTCGLIGGLILCLWKIVVVIITIVGIRLAVLQKESEKRIVIIVIMLVLIGVISLFGITLADLYSEWSNGYSV